MKTRFSELRPIFAHSNRFGKTEIIHSHPGARSSRSVRPLSGALGCRPISRSRGDKTDEPAEREDEEDGVGFEHGRQPPGIQETGRLKLRASRKPAASPGATSSSRCHVERSARKRVKSLHVEHRQVAEKAARPVPRIRLQGGGRPCKGRCSTLLGLVRARRRGNLPEATPTSSRTPN